MSETILVPVDFSDCSFEVTRRAAARASELGAGLLLLHVVELPPTTAPTALVTPEQDGEPVEALAYLLAAAGTEMKRYDGLEALRSVFYETRILEGIPADVILEQAEAVDAIELFMGTHGRTGFAKLMTGSVSEHVSARTKCPVTIIESHHKPSCEAVSCASCDSGALEAQGRLWDELDR